MDDNGQPVLQMATDQGPAQVGVTAENTLQSDAPPQLVRQLLEARLQAELSRRASHGISETEVARDWKLLQKSIAASESRVAAEVSRGSQPYDSEKFYFAKIPGYCSCVGCGGMPEPRRCCPG